MIMCLSFIVVNCVSKLARMFELAFVKRLCEKIFQLIQEIILSKAQMDQSIMMVFCVERKW